MLTHNGLGVMSSIYWHAFCYIIFKSYVKYLLARILLWLFSMKLKGILGMWPDPLVGSPPYPNHVMVYRNDNAKTFNTSPSNRITDRPVIQSLLP